MILSFNFINAYIKEKISFIYIFLSTLLPPKKILIVVSSPKNILEVRNPAEN